MSGNGLEHPDQSSDRSESFDQESLEPLRIILVGRTGLDARLRLDPTVELVRAQDSLQAIGELADPIDLDSPARSVVVVAPGAEPQPHDGQGGSLAEVIDALRVIDPEVRVLRSDDRPEAASGWALYDGTINAKMPVERLRAIVHGYQPPDDATLPTHPIPPIPPAISTSSPSAASHETQSPAHVDEVVDAMGKAPAQAGPAGDEKLVGLMIRGQEVLDEALGLIRERLGGCSVHYVPQYRTEDASEVRSKVAVYRHGRRFGWLVSNEVAEAQLLGHANWLAGWIALTEQHSQLRQAAFTDPLTGAYNRRYFSRFLNKAIGEAKVHRRSVTILVFDIDDFKKYNDAYGHAAGDEVLIETIRLMTSVIRPTDKVCRIGGDEFAVIFYEPSGPRTTQSRHPETISGIASRFQEQICNHRFPKLLNEAPGTLTISGGLATYPWDGQSSAELLECADQLALTSKRQGKNVITFGPGAMRVCQRPPE